MKTASIKTWLRHGGLWLALLASANLWAADAPGSSELVSLKVNREKLLTRGAESLNRENKTLQEKIHATPNLFVMAADLAVPAEVATVAPNATPTALAAPIRYSDQQALSEIADKLSPTGAIILGERKILNLPGGRSLKVGDPIRMSLHDHAYSAILTDISGATFTLQMNSATLTRNFRGSKSGSGSSGITAPSPPAESKLKAE